MEFKDMTVEQLESRMSELLPELDKDVKDIENFDGLEEEIRGIKAELESRKAAETKKAELRSAVAMGAGETITTPIKEERKEMTNAEVRNSAEYINAYANYIKTGKDEECRALLTENVSGGSLPVPELVDSVIRTAWDRDEITRLVKKSYIKGNLKIGFEVSATGAAVHTEGAAAPSEETLVLGITELVPESIKKWISVSDEAIDLSGEEFLRYIYDELTYQIAKKAAEELIADIEACDTVSTSIGHEHVCGVPKVTQTSIAMGTVATALAQLSDEAPNAVIAMNKASFAAWKAVQYANGYAADPFEGLPVVFNNKIKAYSVATTGETYAIVGDFGVGAQMNFPAGEDVKFTFDNLSLAERDLVKVVGRMYVGHDVVAPNAFVKIVK